MEERKFVDNITKKEIEEYAAFLLGEGRSQATAEKYVRDVKKFREILLQLGCREIDEKRVLEYKEYLKNHYKISSVNSMLAAMNSFLEFMGWGDCKVKLYQVPRIMSGTDGVGLQLPDQDGREERRYPSESVNADDLQHRNPCQ